MTRKDYEKIAEVLNLGQVKPYFGMEAQHASDYMAGATDQLNEIRNRIIAILEQDNPRFDRARFLKACGMGD